MHPTTDTTTATAAERILAALTTKRTPNGQSPVWSLDYLAHRSGLSVTVVRKQLPDLLASGRLTSIREERRIDEASLLYAIQSRVGATYYLLPERHRELTEALQARLRAPYLAQARATVLERHAAEVAAEFDRLWAAATAVQG